MRIGQRVKVTQVRDGLAGKASSKVGQKGIISAYKMTDGSGIGVVVKFEDETSSWFFEEELEAV